MKLEHSLEIAAPPEVVWAVTEDVERWPEWSPTVTSVSRIDEGPFDVGSSARVKQPGLPWAVWTVTALDRGRSFTWSTRVFGMTMVATHEIEPAPAATRSVLRIELSGWVAVLLARTVRRGVGKALEKENRGLRKRCESLVVRADMSFGSGNEPLERHDSSV